MPELFEKLRLYIKKDAAFRLTVAPLLVWYNIFLLSGIQLFTADIGRHIKNGELFWQSWEIPQTNLYSYTYPDFPFINHHWGSGLLFYGIKSLAGFWGLSVFYILLSLLTFVIVFNLAKKMSTLPIALFCSTLLIPLIGEREEVRPEIFSYLFSAIFLTMLWNYRQKIITHRWLFLLPVLMALWMNFHIYFIFGLGIIGLFWGEALLIYAHKRSNVLQLKSLTIILLLSSLATLLNPFGLKAIYYPFIIFRNYGYRVLENQSIFFLEGLGFIDNPNFLLFKFTVFLLALSFAVVLVTNYRKFSLPLFGLAITITYLGTTAIRNFSLFGFLALPIMAYNIQYGLKKKIDTKGSLFSTGISIAALLVFTMNMLIHMTTLNRNTQVSLGLLPKVNAAAEFFKRENISGPIFNNYDIGGYLTYHLYPQERVFVDNRPEAYPSSFFTDVYIPMQENNDKWKEVDSQYNFNVIFFYLPDATPWGQQFLVDRFKDESWALVYIDAYAIIFLKRNEKNEAIINRTNIPQLTARIKPSR